MHHNRSITYVIRECLRAFAVLGLWPSWHTRKYRRLHILYSMIAILIAVGTFISSIFVHHIFEYTSLTDGIANIFILSTIVVQFIVVSQSLVNRTKQQQLVAKFAKVDQLIHRKLNVYISYQAEKRHILIRILGIGVTVFVIEIVLRIRLLYRGALASEIFWHFFYADCIARLRCMQILVFVLLLRSRVNLIQNRVKEIFITHNRRLEPVSTRRNVTCKDTNPIFVLNASAEYYSTFDRLLHIKQIYSELYEICESMSTTFGWSLLSFITQSSITFTSLR